MIEVKPGGRSRRAPCSARRSDFGDDEQHACTAAEQRIDPLEVLGVAPARPVAYWGWGALPDQYGRRFDGDDGATSVPANPGLRDLPPLLPGWGDEWRSRPRR